MDLWYYTGLVMSTRYSERKSEFICRICVDPDRVPHQWSDSSNQYAGRIYTVEMEQGAMAEEVYPYNVEVGCSVCSVSWPPPPAPPAPPPTLPTRRARTGAGGEWGQETGPCAEREAEGG